MISLVAEKCIDNTWLCTLSSTAEPDGGDHIATIDFSGNAAETPLCRFISWSVYVVSSWVPISGPYAFLFTSAGESYQLKAVIPEAATVAFPACEYQYSVDGLYAPSWASITGTVGLTVNDSDCCNIVDTSATGTIGTTGVSVAGQSTYIRQSNGCVVEHTFAGQPNSHGLRLTWNHDCTGPTKNNFSTTRGGFLTETGVTLFASGNKPYKWFEKEFDFDVTITRNGSKNHTTSGGMAYTATHNSNLTVSFRKDPNSNIVYVHHTNAYAEVTSPTTYANAVSTSQPCTGGTEVTIEYYDLPCTNYKLRATVTRTMCSGTNQAPRTDLSVSWAIVLP